MLYIKKVYIDTRFKTPDSKSDSDFFIELPRSLNVPEDTICYITDIVIPVSWSTVGENNNKLYVCVQRNSTRVYKKMSLVAKNYDGITFADALHVLLNTELTGIASFEVSYLLSDNEITIKQVSNFDAWVYLVSGADLQSGVYWDPPLPKASIQSLNGVLRLGKNTYKLQENLPYISSIDLHTIRNLYITSSSLASYNIISNFDNDVIIKKVPVKAGYSTILYDSADAGYDFLDVSRRALTRIDFRLQDSYGNIVNLRNNHWSFSLIFQKRS